MKYSLRSLMIVAAVAPAVLAAVAWFFLPAPKPAWWTPRPQPKAGSPESMAFFLRCTSDNPSDHRWPPWSLISAAAKNCFELGTPASRYKALFAHARETDEMRPSFPAGVKYLFECYGDRGIIIHIVIIVDGDPPVIVYVDDYIVAS
jgi:hypothetical protein